MTYLTEAIKVLERAGKPLHYMEIYHGVVRAGNWKSRAKDPSAGARSSLLADIKKHGEQSAFVQTGRATFALRAHVTEGQHTTRSRPETSGKRQSPPRTTGLTFTDSAERVLESLDDNRPIHCAKITEIARKTGLLHTRGRTPEATMSALIGSEIKRARARGERPRFVRHPNGAIGLSKWVTRGLAREIEVHNDRVRERLLRRLLSMDPGEFEDLIQRLLEDMDFKQTEVTRRSKDGGIDVRGTLRVEGLIPIKIAIQVKRWKPSINVQAPEVQRVRGSLGAHEQGLIITTSDFSRGAREEAKRQDNSPIALINGNQLVALLTRYSGVGEIVGVSHSEHKLLEIDEDSPASDNGC